MPGHQVAQMLMRDLIVQIGAKNPERARETASDKCFLHLATGTNPH